MFFKPHVTLYLSLYYDILFYHQNHFIFRNISMLRLASNMSIEYNYAKYHWISKEKKKLCPRIVKSLVLDYESIIIHGQYTNNPFIIR